MKNVLIISPTPSHPTYRGNSERIFRLLLALEELGYDFLFVHIEREKGDEFLMRQTWGDKYIALPYCLSKTPNYGRPNQEKKLVGKVTKKIFSKLRVSYYPNYEIDDWYDSTVDCCLKELSSKHNFCAVIVEYVYFSKALENFSSSILKIIDTHDVFARRRKLFRLVGEVPRFFYTDDANERKGLNRADLVVSIQDREKLFFESELALSSQVKTVGHFLDLKYSFDSKVEYRILFFGSGNHINIRSLNLLANEVMPRVRENVPAATLWVGGSICLSLDADSGFTKLGLVEDKSEMYSQVSVVVNPMDFGTGLKIKNVEAMGYGMPLVTSPIGAEGLEAGIGSALLVGSTPDELARHIVQLLLNQGLRESLSEQAFKFASEMNQHNLKQLSDVLTTTPRSLQKTAEVA